MGGKAWSGIILGAAVGLAIAWALHQFTKYVDPTVTEAGDGSIVIS